MKEKREKEMNEKEIEEGKVSTSGSMETVIFILLPPTVASSGNTGPQGRLFLGFPQPPLLRSKCNPVCPDWEAGWGLTEQWDQEQQAAPGRWRGGEGQREGLSEGCRICPALPPA